MGTLIRGLPRAPQWKTTSSCPPGLWRGLLTHTGRAVLVGLIAPTAPLVGPEDQAEGVGVCSRQQAWGTGEGGSGQPQRRKGVPPETAEALRLVAGVQDAQRVDYGQAQMSGQLWNPEACDHVFKAVAL